jgi:hypothetical protein
MNKITLHPYVSVLSVFVFLSLFAQSFYYAQTIFEISAQVPAEARSQYMYEILRSGMTAFTYLIVSVYFALSLAQKKPILTITSFNPEEESGLAKKFQEKIASKVNDMKKEEKEDVSEDKKDKKDKK